jgi:hypothetical protein
MAISQSVFNTETRDDPGGTDRRRSPRFDCAGSAEAFAADPCYLFRGEIRDISETGCYVMTKARLRLERFTELDVLFMLRNRNHRAAARVMNFRPGQGVGLEFLSCVPSPEESFLPLPESRIRFMPVQRVQRNGTA